MIYHNKKRTGVVQAKPKPVKPVTAKPVPSSKAVHVGDSVKVVNAVTYDGKKFKAWYPSYKVMEVKGDRVVIGVNGIVTAAIKDTNIKKV